MKTLALIMWAATAHTSGTDRWVGHWAVVYGVEPELIKAVIEAESGGNARAISTAGAVGVMQLMPETAVAFGVRSRFDIEDNIRGGVAYLAWLRDQCGSDRRLIVASYIAGRSRVARVGLGAYPAEVHVYVERVAYLYRRNRWEKLLREGALRR